jgi:hypothetical protein
MSWNTTLESVEYQRHEAKSEAWPTGDRQPGTLLKKRVNRAHVLKTALSCECVSECRSAAGRTDHLGRPKPVTGDRSRLGLHTEGKMSDYTTVQKI